MIKSGRNCPTPAMPMPDFAVPKAAPMPFVSGQSSIFHHLHRQQLFLTAKDHLQVSDALAVAAVGGIARTYGEGNARLSPIVSM